MSLDKEIQRSQSFFFKLSFNRFKLHRTMSCHLKHNLNKCWVMCKGFQIFNFNLIYQIKRDLKINFERVKIELWFIAFIFTLLLNIMMTNRETRRNLFLIELPGAKSSIIFKRRIAIIFIVLSATELQSSFWLTSLMEKLI